MIKTRNGIDRYVSNARCVLTSKKGEGYVDTGVKILIAVVIGALILALLYAMFKDTIMTTLETKIKDLFSYTG